MLPDTSRTCNVLSLSKLSFLDESINQRENSRTSDYLVPIYLAYPFHILERGTPLIIADKLLK
jgi:hypothetical protein